MSLNFAGRSAVAQGVEPIVAPGRFSLPFPESASLPKASRASEIEGSGVPTEPAQKADWWTTPMSYEADCPYNSPKRYDAQRRDEVNSDRLSVFG